MYPYFLGENIIKGKRKKGKGEKKEEEERLREIRFKGVK
jgi:hypothetical protein